jgi:hypothetical protein
MRTTLTPKILPKAFNGFLYSNKWYNLGSCKIEDPDIHLNKQKIHRLQNRFDKKVSKDRFGYEMITLSFQDSESYFKFLYTPTVQNFEKTDYKVSCLEELYVFVEKFLECGKAYNIRYCEAFVSAYKPTHQNIFYDFGLEPHGYVPSWNYNQKTGKFEDCILFNWFEGEISKDIQLLEEGKELVEMLGFCYSDETDFNPVNDLPVNDLILSEPVSFRERLVNKNSNSTIIKPTIMTGLVLYLLLLFGGLGTANMQGYQITTHAISKLGSLEVTHLPILFDLSSILGGFTTILFYYSFTKRIESQLHHKKYNISEILRYTMIIGIIGSLGIIMVGIFSVDRDCGLCHTISSVFAFGGFTLSLLIFGVVILQLDTKIPKSMGVPGMLPILAFILQCIFASPLLEWILLLSIIFALIPLFMWFVFH